MILFDGALAQRAKNAGKSGSRLWGLVIVAIGCIIFYGHLAIVESDIAQRQQTSFGTTDDCERRGRGNENWCHYTFAVGSDWYKGVSETYPEVTFGQTVQVFYDSQNPAMNALEDFSGKSRKDEHFVYILPLVLAVAGAVILWNEGPEGTSPDELTP